MVIYQSTRYKALWIILEKKMYSQINIFLSLRAYVKSVKVNQFVSVMVVGGVVYVMKASAKVCLSLDGIMVFDFVS